MTGDTQDPLATSEQAAAFWSWFASVEEGYHRVWRECASSQEFGSPALRQVIDEVHSKLHEVFSPQVFLELGPEEEPGRFRLVLTVRGCRPGVADLKRLAASALALERWAVCTFRPPTSDVASVTVQWEDVRVGVQDIDCCAELIEGDIVVILFAKPVSETNGPGSEAAMLLMDAIVGEELVVTAIDELLIAPFGAEPQQGVARLPLLDLPERLASLVAER